MADWVRVRDAVGGQYYTGQGSQKDMDIVLKSLKGEQIVGTGI